MKQVRVFRLGSERVLSRTHQWIDAGTSVVVRDREFLYYDHQLQSSLPLHGEIGLYILERELEEVHEPSIAS